MISKKRLNKIFTEINQQEKNKLTFSDEAIGEYFLQIGNIDKRTLEQFCQNRYKETQDKKYLRSFHLSPELQKCSLFEGYLKRMIQQKANNNQT